jgi:hypothetical protein
MSNTEIFVTIIQPKTFYNSNDNIQNIDKVINICDINNIENDVIDKEKDVIDKENIHTIIKKTIKPIKKTVRWNDDK